jgi:arylsulfatase A-like enzyme
VAQHPVGGDRAGRPFDRWPTGPLFGFDRFYGFMGGDNDQWYPKLFTDTTPIDAPRTPREGYHLSEDLVDKSIAYIANNESVDPDKPWLLYPAFGACHAPHHAPSEWIDKYRGRFDMGWDAYRQQVLARQKELGIVPDSTELSPMLEGVPAWEELDEDRRRLFARMAEVYAGFLSHTDHQLGRLIDFLEETGDLGNTLVMVFIGDNGSSGEGTLDGLYNEMSLAAYVPETLEFKLERLDQLGQPGSYNHYPVGWSLAGNTPSSCASSTCTSAASATPWSSTGPRASRPGESCATSSTTSSISSPPSWRQPGSTRPRWSTASNRPRSRACR